MKKLSMAMCLFFSGLILETAADPLFYGQSYGFVVNDPAGFVAAMDEYRESEAGQSSPAMPVLVQNIVNGDYASTHQVSVFYPSTQAMDRSVAINSASPDWSKFQGKIRQLARPEWENVYAIQLAKVKKDPTTLDNAVSIVYAMTVTDVAEYVSAFETLLESDEVKAFPGNIYLGQNIAAGNVPGTHFVTFVAESRGELIEHIMKVQGSPAMAIYSRAVAGIRTVEATNMFREVKRWVPTTN